MDGSGSRVDCGGRPRPRSSGDTYTSELATVGLLEDLQNACLQSKAGIRLLDVRELLAPKSKAAWDDLMTFWHGKPDEARRRLPPGSIPAG